MTTVKYEGTVKLTSLYPIRPPRIQPESLKEQNYKLFEGISSFSWI